MKCADCVMTAVEGFRFCKTHMISRGLGGARLADMRVVDPKEAHAALMKYARASVEDMRAFGIEITEDEALDIIRQELKVAHRLFLRETFLKKMRNEI